MESFQLYMWPFLVLVEPVIYYPFVIWAAWRNIYEAHTVGMVTNLYMVVYIDSIHMHVTEL